MESRGARAQLIKIKFNKFVPQVAPALPYSIGIMNTHKIPR